MASFVKKIREKGRRKHDIDSGSGQYSAGAYDSIEGLSLTDSPSFHGRLQFVDLQQSISGTTAIASKPSEAETSSAVTTAADCDLGYFQRNLRPFKRKSRLSKSLLDVLQDPSALAYFAQFMQVHNVHHLVKFWLDVECFRVTTNQALFPSCSNNHVKDNIERGNGAVAQNCFEDSRPLPHAFVQDAISIFSKYIGKEAVCSINVSDDLRNKIVNSICCEDGALDPGCFDLAQQYIFQILEKRYFPEFQRSVYYCKHVMDVLSTGPVFLSDIIYNDAALLYFTEFLDLEGVRFILEFWLAADNFRQQLFMSQQDTATTLTPDQIQADAMVLYDRYFSLQARTPLGFTDQVRLELENNICKEEGPASDSFDKPMLFVWNLFEKEYLPKFLRSPLYLKYLAELTHIINNALELPTTSRLHRRAVSIAAASEVSSGDMSLSTTRSAPLDSHIGFTSALTSNDDPKATARQHQIRHVTTNGSLGIDIKGYDPDSLWKRPSSSLSLGRVDILGDFVSECEQEPMGNKSVQKTASKLPKALRKLVNKEPDAMEREIAAQVAHLIIQDIHNLTHNCAKDDL